MFALNIKINLNKIHYFTFIEIQGFEIVANYLEQKIKFRNSERKSKNI